MRFITATATILLFTPPAWAFDMPKGFEEIGKFSVVVNGEPLELTSTASERTEYSDVYLMTHADETQHIINAYTVKAVAGMGENGPATPPILMVEFDEDRKTGTLMPARVILVDQNWDNALATYPELTQREIKMDNLVFTKDGAISFDVSADLVRLNWDQYMPVPDAPIVRIQGHYSGKFPAFALEYPHEPGDD